MKRLKSAWIGLIVFTLVLSSVSVQASTIKITKKMSSARAASCIKLTEDMHNTLADFYGKLGDMYHIFAYYGAPRVSCLNKYSVYKIIKAETVKEANRIIKRANALGKKGVTKKGKSVITLVKSCATQTKAFANGLGKVKLNRVISYEKIMNKRVIKIEKKMDSATMALIRAYA